MQEQRYLILTAFLVALVGAPAVYSVVRDPSATGPEVHEIQRAPAQIAQEQQSSPTKPIKSRSVILDYDCNKAKEITEVDGTLLRLKGKSCLDEKWTDVSVVNETNGFTGSVIFLKNNNFTTDFIDLKEGDNRLSFHAIDEEGQPVVQSFTVKRRFPAAVEDSSQPE